MIKLNVIPKTPKPQTFSANFYWIKYIGFIYYVYLFHIGHVRKSNSDNSQSVCQGIDGHFRLRHFMIDTDGGPDLALFIFIYFLSFLWSSFLSFGFVTVSAISISGFAIWTWRFCAKTRSRVFCRSNRIQTASAAHSCPQISQPSSGPNSALS